MKIIKYLNYLHEKFMLQNTYHEGRKVWYSQTLIDASKNLPIKNMSITNKLLNTKVEWTVNTYFDIKNHLLRIKNSNLKYPIIISPKGIIIDGYHRLMKSILENKRSINYVKLDVMPPHDFLSNRKY